MARKISQREARKMRKRLAELDQMERVRRNRWASDYPGGVHLTSLTVSDQAMAGRLAASNLFGAALVAKFDSGTLRIFAILPDKS